MRGRSSRQETKQERMEIDHKLSKLNKEEPHLSGAYIRSLVKQLTSSRTKDPMNPKDPDYCSAAAGSNGDGLQQGQNLTKFGQGFGDTQQTQQPQQQPQQHKKQVRRRLHTSRPYQERLLNMAEARKEIVTALKYHRAAMKQAQEQQQQQQRQPQPQQEQQEQQAPTLEPPPPPQPCFEQEAKIKSRRNPRIYPSNTATNFTNYLDSVSFSHHHHPPTIPHPNNHFPFPGPQIPPPPVSAENLNFTLPNTPLGLNLNFHDFSNLDTNLYHHNSNNNPSSSIYSSNSSPSSSSSPALSVATEETPSVHHHHHPVGADLTDSGGGLHHPAMDDEEMAEIRSLGEQHEMEWNDTMNLVTSAWWFKFLKAEEEEDMVDGYNPFPFHDEVMQFPSWLSANESSLGLQQHYLSGYCCSKDGFQDPALPCMDIGEFEGMDGEWLA